MVSLSVNKQNFYLKVFPEILFIFLIFIDSINGYLQEFVGLYTPIGVFSRSVVLLFCIKFLFVVKHNILLLLFKILLYLYILSLPIWYLYGSPINLYSELNYLFRFIYFFSILFFFYYFRNEFDAFKIVKLIVWASFIIASINIFCFLFNTGIRSYGDDFGFGIKAFYADGNSLGLYMIMSLSLSIWYTFYKKGIYFLISIVITIGTMLIGSRASIFGSILSWVLVVVYFIFRKDRYVSMSKVLKLFFCVFFGGGMIFVGIKIMDFISSFDAYTMERFTIGSIVSPRAKLIDAAKTIISNFDFVQDLIGNGKSGALNLLGSEYLSSGMEKSVEADFHDMILSFGWIFGGMMIILQISIVASIVYSFFKHKNSLTYTLSVIMVMWIAASYMAGHGFNNTMLAPLVGAFYMLSKNDKIISNAK